MCVAPAHYAQADLDALQRVGDPGLSAIATNGAGDIVDQILGVTSTRGATLVGDGPLTGPAVDLLDRQGPTVAIAAADLTAQDSQRRTGHRRRRAAPLHPRGGRRAVRPDRRRRTGRGRRRSVAPRISMRHLMIPLQHDSTVARRQDALGSMLWRGLHPEAEPRSQILMPPMAWDLQPDDAAAILTAVATSIRCGPGRAAPADRGDRREPGGAAAGRPARCPAEWPRTRGPASTTP